ncbi:transposable element Tcb1 transposase [Trichonephila clavipes]|nr:transposable element Tcb1 transposase [Trichonephila clavipes]
MSRTVSTSACVTTSDEQRSAADSDGIQRFPHRCGDSSKESTTDRRGRSHLPQCTTSREDRQIVRMAVTDRSVTLRTVAQHIESVMHHSVSARIIRRRLQQSDLRDVGASYRSLPSGLGHSHISTG